ncbi:hypothetical protein MKEN_00921200 [Mycena kentingensis (nom. inval.)]|nr:hypothetical protein MKEN_00921200 [Mycena kentingensis (nom. inval.)]
MGRNLYTPEFGCKELRHVAFILDFLKPSSGPDVSDDATRWVEEYESKHPSYARWALLLAQRREWFRQYATVHPRLVVSVDKATSGLSISDCAGVSVSVERPITDCSWSEFATRILGKWINSTTRSQRLLSKPSARSVGSEGSTSSNKSGSSAGSS